MTAGTFAFGFPNPFDLVGGVFDGLLGAGASMIGNAVAEAVSWLVEAVLGALVDLAAAVLGFFWDAAEPETGAAWFSGGPSTPYGDMVVLAAPLLVVFFFAGVIQGTLRGDTAGMVRMALLRLPGAVVAMAVTVAGTDLLLRVSDEMSRAVLGGFRDDVESSTQMLGTVALLSGPGGAAQFLMIVFGLVGLIAAVVLVIELFVRAALIYIVVALSPLVYAAAVWESMKGAVRKLAELGLALILSKFVISLALALSASAMVAAWGGESSPTEIITPEAAAAASADGGGPSENVGVLVGAIVMFGVAVFMPFVLYRLLPLAEGALVAQGVRGGPLRAAQQASSAATTARYNPASMALAAGRARTQRSTSPSGAGVDHGPEVGPATVATAARSGMAHTSVAAVPRQVPNGRGGAGRGPGGGDRPGSAVPGPTRGNGGVGPSARATHGREVSAASGTTDDSLPPLPALSASIASDRPRPVPDVGAADLDPTSSRERWR